MRVPAQLYADDTLLEAALADPSIEQLVNTTALPGIVSHTLAMPDIHQGYGFPIGGVAATALPDGVISPGGVGYDINCGVRFLASNIDRDHFMPLRDVVVDALARSVPTGVGRGGDVQVNGEEMDKVLAGGARWAIKHGFGSQEDLAVTEENGGFTTARPRSRLAQGQGARQRPARHPGQRQPLPGGAGSRGDIRRRGGRSDGPVRRPDHRAHPLRIAWPGPPGLHRLRAALAEEPAAPTASTCPTASLSARRSARPKARTTGARCRPPPTTPGAIASLLAHRVRQTFNEVLKGKVKDTELRQVYDVAHNIAKVEEYEIGGRTMKLCVHRKGATRAFPAGSPDYPAGLPRHRPAGDHPGQHGHSILRAGRAEGGAGADLRHRLPRRRASAVACRSQARGAAPRTLLRDLARQGIRVKGASMAGIVEEAPDAYKDVTRVVNVVHKAGIARKVVRLRPLGVIKG